MKDKVSPALAALKKEILQKSSLAAAAREMGINPSALTRHLSGTGISLWRFIDLVEYTGLTPAELFCRVEGKMMIDSSSEEMFHELKAARLKIERLEKELVK